MTHDTPRCWAATHPGAIRPDNQDALLCRPDLGLFAVADGAGGHDDGEFAAKATLARLDVAMSESGSGDPVAALRRGAAAAHEELCAAGAGRGSGRMPATTLVVMLLQGRHFACLWAGDSRAYLLRHGRMHRLTSDHSVVQSLLAAGDITESEAEHHPQANVITRAIGAHGEVPILDKSIGECQPGDCILLCSDGLYRTMTDDEMAACMAGDGDRAAKLVLTAVQRGARDNVTALAVEPSAD